MKMRDIPLALAVFVFASVLWGATTANAQPLSDGWAPGVRFISEPGDTTNDLWVSPPTASMGEAQYRVTVTLADEGSNRLADAQDHESVIVQLVNDDGVVWQSPPTVDLRDDVDDIEESQSFVTPSIGGFTGVVVMHAVDRLGSYDSVELVSVGWAVLLDSGVGPDPIPLVTVLPDDPALEVVEPTPSTTVAPTTVAPAPTTTVIEVTPTTTTVVEVAEPPGLEPIPSTIAAPAPRSSSEPPELAVTGAETGWLAGVGSTLLAVGLWLTGRARRMAGSFADEVHP